MVAKRRAPKKKGRAADLTCETCRKTFRHNFTKKGGRPPQYCSDCRKPRGAVWDEAGARKRKNQRRRMKDANAAPGGHASAAAPLPLTDASTVVVNTILAARLAAAYRVTGDLASAGARVGITDRLDELLELAKKHHRDILDGDLGGLGRRIQSAITMAVEETTLAIATQSIAPRELPNTGMRLAWLRDSLIGKEKKHNFTAIVLEVVGPGGKRVQLGAPAATTVEQEQVEDEKK